MITLTDEALLNYINEYFEYDASAGHFLRVKKTNKNQKLGAFVGSTRKDGYINVSICGRLYLEHRLVWLFFFKYLPEEIDHINRNTSDNRITNLREATRSTNMHNTSAKKNRSLPKGVHKHNKKFKAVLGVSGVQVHLGVFKTPLEAETAYLKAKHEYFDI